MRIAEVLRHKGAEVVTIRAEDTVSVLVQLLAEHRIGALVVSPDGHSVAGIVSERDVVRRLAVLGQDVLAEPVASIMTATVQSCTPEDGIEDLMWLMTEKRIRHVPVLVDGKLAGIVTIGDIVKRRIDQLQSERDLLVEYIQQ